MNRSYMHICTVLSPGQVSVLLYPLALLKKWITKLLAFRGTSPIASCVVDVSVQALGERCFPKAPNLAYQLACTWACKDALYLITFRTHERRLYHVIRCFPIG